jgi:hypothetical protein
VTRALIVILLAGLVLAASSCGGGDGGSKQLSASEYETQVGDILQPLQQTTLPNIVAIAPTDRERAVTALKNGEARLQNAASELGSMQPPADAVDPTQRLADGISHISDEVTAARKDAEHGDFGKLVQFKLNIASDPAVAEVQAAVRDLINLGYDIAGTGP